MHNAGRCHLVDKRLHPKLFHVLSKILLCWESMFSSQKHRIYHIFVKDSKSKKHDEINKEL